MQNQVDRRTPSHAQSHRRGSGELRTLLRSRGVLTLLAAVATVQGTGLAVARDARPGAAVAERAPELLAVPRVAAAPAPTLRALRLLPAAAPRVASRKAATPASPSKTTAELLAARYRKKGYNVPSPLARRIHQAALEAGLDPKVAFGLVRTESSFRNTATSNVGAIGLTQLMPATARWLEPGTTRSDLRNPDKNLRIGFRYLKKLIAQYDGNTEIALTAYNRGPGTVNRILRRGGNPDNGYAGAVLDR